MIWVLIENFIVFYEYYLMSFLFFLEVVMSFCCCFRVNLVDFFCV